ncbi:GNAT family N-acetyltransferase [Planococcus liqunii]|nr:GNAT family N-acetyltransferase [Planococcus sp. N056]WKA52698.1 GNAT family N-acetyltransferase [Planococcus sp. N056]
MRLRRAREEDFKTLEGLFKSMGKVEHRGFQNRFEEMVHNPSYFLIVAFHGAEAIGYALVQDYGRHLRLGKKTCRLHDLYVLSNYRQLGIAHQLMEATFEWCQSVDAKWLQWNTSKEAIGFYEKIGCKCLSYDGETPEFEVEF